MDLLSLPIECTSWIVRYLSVSEALTLTSTCKYLHSQGPYDVPLKRILERVSGFKDSSAPVQHLIESLVTCNASDELRRLLLHGFPNYHLLVNTSDTILTTLFRLSLDPKPLTSFLISACESLFDKQLETHSRRILDDVIHIVCGLNFFNEEIVYHMLHLHWHYESDIIIPYSSIVNLERFIHLAILMDCCESYTKLIQLRTSSGLETFNSLSGEIGDKVTDQDVFTVVRYGSRGVFWELSLRSSPTLTRLVNIVQYGKRGNSMSLGQPRV